MVWAEALWVYGAVEAAVAHPVAELKDVVVSFVLFFVEAVEAVDGMRIAATCLAYHCQLIIKRFATVLGFNHPCTALELLFDFFRPCRIGAAAQRLKKTANKLILVRDFYFVDR